MPFIVFFLKWGSEQKVLINKVFELSHNENIKKTTEVLRKPGKLSLPL